MNYKEAGVNVHAGYRSTELIKKLAGATLLPQVLSGIGGFGAMFSIKEAKEMDDPVLVSGSDGVGTKLKIAFLTGRHDTIGVDCVAMCANDIVCCGAKPLFFLDYIACGKNYPEKIETIVKGVANGCVAAGMSLIGGETAEMPDFYAEDDYDIAGFAVGVIDKPKIIDGSRIREGDALIGLASSGLHSNGYSLARKVLRPTADTVSQHIDSFGATLGEELLRPTEIYVRPALSLISLVPVAGIAHITGGGFIENIPRMFAKDSGLNARIQMGAWEIPPIFDFIKAQGDIKTLDMYETFNMGIGMVFAVPEKDAESALKILEEQGRRAFIIGSAVKGDDIVIC
jgi:phosphoribosylformylglycinamidine cyclo-ligase